MQTKVIFKYSITAGSITVPKGSTVLSTGIQAGDLKVWVLQPTPAEDQETEQIDLYYVGTGWDVSHDPKDAFIGTVQDSNGFVWHVFARYLDRE